MFVAGRKLAAVLNALEKETRAGVIAKDLDKLAYDLILAEGAKPAFLNSRPGGADKPYPYTLCISLNDVVVHGQPSNYVIKDGDVASLDLGLKYKGYYVDSAITVGVGTITKEANKLMEATKEALVAGIKEAKLGNTLGDVGYAIANVVHKRGFSVADGLVGHGIGRTLHEDPIVFNFGRRGEGEELEEGMVIAIEPMVNAGGSAVRTLKDESFATRDGSLSAHFEHTVAITKHGPQILTCLD